MRRLFLSCKIAIASGIPCSQPPLASGRWGLHPHTSALLLPSTITTLSSSFLSIIALNRLYFIILLLKKNTITTVKLSALASSALLHLGDFSFNFTSNSVLFVGGGEGEGYFLPRAHVALATPQLLSPPPHSTHAHD